MPYTPNKVWSEGQTVQAGHLNHVESGLEGVSFEAEEAARLNVAKFGVKTGATGAANRKGINEAIAALPETGGTLFFPERGQYLVGVAGKTEPIEVQERSGVVLLGQGGVSAGGGLGYPKGGKPAVNFPPTYLAYEGNGDFVNAKKTTGFGIENLELYAFKTAFGEGSYIVNASESNFMYLTNVTLQCVADPATTKMVKGKLLNLHDANCGLFIRTWFKGGKEAIIGRTEAAPHFSYAHCFLGGGVVAQTGKSVVHIHDGWSFNNFAFEPHYDENGVEIGAGEGWIGQTGGGAFESIGTTLMSCFFGAGTGKESGNGIEWFGNGLTIIGGELANCENALVIPIKSSNITMYPHINLCVVGLVISSTNANEVSRVHFRPSFGKRSGGGAITPTVFVAGKPKSALLQGTEGEEFKKLKAAITPAATLACAKEAAELANELRLVLISQGAAE